MSVSEGEKTKTLPYTFDNWGGRWDAGPSRAWVAVDPDGDPVWETLATLRHESIYTIQRMFGKYADRPEWSWLYRRGWRMRRCVVDGEKKAGSDRG